jgi:hypothetical protein
VYAVYLSIQRPLVADAIVREGTPEFALAKKLAGSKLLTQKDEDGVRMAYMQNAIDTTSAQRAETPHGKPSWSWRQKPATTTL